MSNGSAESAADQFPWPAYALGGALYAERDEKILIMQRAAGEGTGLWGLPQGAVEAGERPEEAAVRELYEEARLVPTGALTIIGLFPMHVYGRDAYMASYACECADGDVVLNEEHSRFLWTDPAEYRKRMTQFIDSAGDAPVAKLVTEFRDDLDRYMAWRTSARAG